MNFPILQRLREAHEVRVVAFNNGSSSFFKAFHPETTGVSSKAELISLARSITTEYCYVSYPTWRKELAASFFTGAQEKFLARAPDYFWARGLWRFRLQGDPTLHHLENNLRLLEKVPRVNASLPDFAEALGVSVAPEGRILGVHPTASTPVKYYPIRFWHELLNLCADEFDAVKIFCGKSETETRFCKQIAEGVHKAKVHAGLDFKTLAAELGRTSSFIGSDSALLHLTALLGKRALGLWSFANFRVIYPYGNQVQVMLPEETLSAKRHDYPDQIPAYMSRASSRRAYEILREQTPVSFSLQPRHAKAIRFYTF